MPTYDGIGSSVTHEIEVVGDVFISNVEGGSLSTQVPFEIFSNVSGMATPPTDSRQVRLRVQPSAEASPDDSYVTDMGIQNTTDNYFFITAPQNTSTVGVQNTFVISKTTNVGIGTTDPQQSLHVVGNAWITGTLTTSNIVGTSPVTISSGLVIGPGATLIAAAIEPPSGVESNMNITGTITTSNITHGSKITVTSNLLMGSDKTLTTSNIETSNLTVSNRLSGGTISVSNIEATANLVVGGPVDITGTLSAAGITSSTYVNVTGTITTSDIVAHANENLLINSNLEVGTSNLFVNTMTGNVGIGTDDPQHVLHVVGTASSILEVQNTGDTARVQLNGSAGKGGDLIFQQNGTSTWGIASIGDKLHILGDDLTSQKRMTFDDNGNVGIGNESSNAKLQVNYTEGSLSTISYGTPSTWHDKGIGLIGGTGGFIYGHDINHSIFFRRSPFYTGGDNNAYVSPGYHSFHTGNLVGNAGLLERMRITAGGNVGIGTASPSARLHVVGGTDSIYILKNANTGGVGIKFSDKLDEAQYGTLRFYHADAASFGAGAAFRLATSETSEVLAIGGSLMIGVDGKDSGSVGNGRKNLWIQSTYGGNTSQNYGWWIGTQNSTLTSGDNDLHFTVLRNGAASAVAYIQDDVASEIKMNFTGQHRTFIKNIPYESSYNYEGMIVCSDNNEYIRMSRGITKGMEAITINESLPLVSLSNVAYDKKCFGVISFSEDPNQRKEINGSFVSVFKKEEGDIRVYINSVGEGAMWVVNTNGNMESGDYITTSNVAGYGQLQDDDILHNYTVAKITMDCDFNPPQQPVQIILKDEEGNNILDQYGQLQWIDDPSGATEAAYKVKELDGGILAAFVGCTYHCG